MYQTNQNEFTDVFLQNERPSNSNGLNTSNNDKVFISGLFEDEVSFDHVVLGESFYSAKVKVMRQSGNMDILPVIMSERLFYDYMNKPLKDRYVEIVGEIRSYSKTDDKGKSRLKVRLFALGIKIFDDDDYEEYEGDSNSVYLRGFICRTPSYRTTPYGREITDLMLAVNRRYGKSSYVPCIVWGRNARFMTNFDVGTEIEVYGRFQSREYEKVLSVEHNISETRTTYEISVNRVNVVRKEAVL